MRKAMLIAKKADPALSNRAVMYIRMSTEQQRYSPVNHAQTIQNYADRHLIMVMATYADLERSGLSIERRDSLQKLIAIVESGQADFGRILVYDVSRWGRFQDIDESAYYEHHCRRHGIAVEYCADEFLNDGTAYATMAKYMKRMAAADYSRELSVKSFQGQRLLAQMGYRMGGYAGYGLRRMRVSEDGARRGVLHFGERKAIQSERVILVPGPSDEVGTVQWIYHAFINLRLSTPEIARQLNASGRFRADHPWREETVREVLRNDKYVGSATWNRTSQKLQSRPSRNPREMWVSKPYAYQQLIEPALQEAAKARLFRRLPYTDDEMLAMLASFAREAGNLTRTMIDEARSLPSAHAYTQRFGSLLEAYERIGYRPRYNYRAVGMRRFCRAVAEKLANDICSMAEKLGASVVRTDQWWLLDCQGEMRVSVTAVCCLPIESGSLRWYVYSPKILDGDVTVIVRLTEKDRDRLDYYIIPRTGIVRFPFIIKGRNDTWAEPYRSDNLDPLASLIARVPLMRAA
ncbi:MAG: recombinase family protein [Sphingomonadales bacterium]